MASNIADSLTSLETFVYNPASIQQQAVQTVSDVTNGVITIVDATNPAVLVLESAAVMVAGFMNKSQLDTRKQYASLSQTSDDLYGHMSDEDYLNRFAVPTTATMNLMFIKADLINAMVTDTTLGYSKVVIPRDTVFTVANTDFSLQYPIEIRLLGHGGIQVAYDLSETSPIQTIDSDVIEWELKTDGTNEYVFFSFLTTQMSVTSREQSINASVLTQMTYTLTDAYYYTRVWHQNTDNTWTEINTTHSPLVYDAATATAVLQVNGSTLTVQIPQIYTTATTSGGTPLLTGKIRADVYTTQGDISLVLSTYSYGSFSANYQWLDSSADTTYSAPLSTLSAIIYSTTTTSGGSDATTFATLREQVINNTTGPITIPITSVQAAQVLSDAGYQIVNEVDNITDQIFLAARAMPTPVNSDLITAANATSGTLSFTLDGLASYSYVIDNTSSLTITPNALYQEVNGVMNFVSDTAIAQLQALSVDEKAVTISAGKYRYCPFYYVLDNTTVEFAVRAYYLDGPSVLTKLYGAVNDTTGIEVSTGSYVCQRTTGGYTLQVGTSSNDAFKALADSDVVALLAFTPDGEKQPAYLLGTQYSLTSAGERVFNFNLATNFNVTSDNAIQLTEFAMFTSNTIVTNALLTQDFSIYYCTTAQMPSGFVSSSMDAALPSFLVPKGSVAITQETLRVQFGQALDRLWARSRTTASSTVYQTYTVAVPATYTEDVYQTDSSGSFISFDSNGDPEYDVIHKAGDPVLDSKGNAVMLHAVGDPVLNPSTGLPIPVSNRVLAHQVDIFLVEGVYLYANDTSASDYRAQLISSLVEWITTDLEAIAPNLIEQRSLYYYPQITMGAISVLANNQSTSIEASQSLIVTLQVSKAVYNNTDLRTQLNTSTVSQIATDLQSASVSLSSILTDLRTLYGSDVVDVQIEGLGGTAALSNFTVLDNAARCSLKKVLTAQSDNSLIVEEDVTINYVLHDTTSVTTS